MNAILNGFSDLFSTTGQQTDATPLWELAGWTMCLFLIAGTVVALIGGLLHRTLRNAAPQIRYTLSLAVFTTLAVLPIGIGVLLFQNLPVENLVVETDVAPLELTPSETSAPLAAADTTTPPVIDLKYNPITVDAEIPALPETNVTERTNEIADTPQKNEGVTAFLSVISSSATAIKYLPWLWIIGAPLTFLLLSTGLIGSERLRKHSKQLVDGPLFDTGEKLRGILKISRRVGIAVCERITSPLLVGVFRPMILLPPAALTGWTPEQLEMVLLHELAHVRRWDNLVNFFQRVVESLLFFHPAVWWVSRWVRSDREECCDAVVVARTEKPQAYAELLVALATPRSSSSSPLVGLAMAQHPLAGRIRRILKLEDEKMLVTRSTFAWFTLATIAVIAVTAWQPMTTSIAQEPAVAEKSNDETTKDAKETKQAKQVTKIYLLKENDNIPIAKWVKRLDQHNISPIHYYEKNDGLVVSCTQAQHEQLADLLEEHRAAEETKHTLGRPSVLFVLTAKTPQSTIDAFIEWNNKRDGNTCTVTKLANGTLTLTIEDKAGNIHTTKAQRFTALEGGRIEIEGEVSQTVLPSIDLDARKSTTENTENKEESFSEAIFSDQIPAVGAEPRDEKLWQETQIALIKSDLVLRQAVLAIAQNSDFQAPSVSWFQDNLRVRFIPGGVILGLQENKPNSGGLLSYYVKEVGKSYLAERKRQQIKTITENTKTGFFPSLADQRDADLAYKLLNIEFEPLDATELKRVKAAKFAGGLRVGVSTGRSKGGIWRGDILVGLHVWPTTSLDDVRKILEREDIRELTPLKFYVLRKTLAGGGGGYGGDGQFGQSKKSPNGTDYIVTGRIPVRTNAIKNKPTTDPFAPAFQPAPARKNSQPKVAPRDLKVGDMVKVIVAGTPPDQPIADVYEIEEMGTVALGPTYGRVKLAGLTLLEAEEKVKKQLKTVLKDAQVQITLFRKLGVHERTTFNPPSELSTSTLTEKQKNSIPYQKVRLEHELKRAQLVLKSAKIDLEHKLRKSERRQDKSTTQPKTGSTQVITPVHIRQAQAKVQHAELIVQRAEAMLLDAVRDAQQEELTKKLQKPTLLYDGKTFDEWQTQWKTELKTEERTEAIRALAAFGRAGYGKEAAETILDVAGEYDFQTITNSPAGKLKRQVLNVLTMSNGHRLATKFWLPKLLERYRSDPKKWRWLANQSLWRLSSLQVQEQWTQQQLLKLARDKDDLLSIAAIHALQSSPIDDSQVVTLIDELIASDDNKQVLQGISLLRCNVAIGGGGGVYGGGTVFKVRSFPALLKVLQHQDLKVRRYARVNLTNIPDNDAEQIINLLQKKLQVAKTDQERIPVIRSFAALGARAKSANDLLANFQDKQYSKSVRLAAAYAYACFWTPTGHNKYLTYANKFQDGSGAPINGENFHKEAKQIFPEPKIVSGGGGFGGGGGGAF